MKVTRRGFIGAVSGGAALVGATKAPMFPVVGYRKEMFGANDLTVVIKDNDGMEISRAPCGPFTIGDSSVYNTKAITFIVTFNRVVDITQYEVIDAQGRLFFKDHLTKKCQFAPGDANPMFAPRALSIRFS